MGEGGAEDGGGASGMGASEVGRQESGCEGVGRTWRMNAMSAALCTKEAATKSTPRLTPKFCRPGWERGEMRR